MDDLLDTGKTLATTVDLLKGEGADTIYGFATHARYVVLLGVPSLPPSLPPSLAFANLSLPSSLTP